VQRFRVASADSLLPPPESQEPAHYLAIQILDIDMFLFKPPTEIGDYDDLLSDGALMVALFGHVGRIGVEVLTQGALAQSFNRTSESEELVYHSPRVPRQSTTLCRIAAVETPMNGGWHDNMRHSPGRGIVPPMPHAA
jgi:hypothetical protein